MRIDRAITLAAERGYKLRCAENHYWDLMDPNGQWVDNLHTQQIGELDELDFIEFYIDDPEYVARVHSL